MVKAIIFLISYIYQLIRHYLFFVDFDWYMAIDNNHSSLNDCQIPDLQFNCLKHHNLKMELSSLLIPLQFVDKVKQEALLPWHEQKVLFFPVLLH